MMLSLSTAYRSFDGEVEASSTPTICRLPDSRRHQIWAIAQAYLAGFSEPDHVHGRRVTRPTRVMNSRRCMAVPERSEYTQRAARIAVQDTSILIVAHGAIQH